MSIGVQYTFKTQLNLSTVFTEVYMKKLKTRDYDVLNVSIVQNRKKNEAFLRRSVRVMLEMATDSTLNL